MKNSQDFFKGKRVFITGHTGFKGSWLCLWLHLLGAEVYGYALPPPTKPSLFELCRIDELMTSMTGDIRKSGRLNKVLRKIKPEIVFHLAAQPIVRRSYAQPVETYSVNVMGLVHLLEAIRGCESVRSAVIVTTDKCYRDRHWPWPYRELDELGGNDPYSSSKACMELIADAYRAGFSGMASFATARAGNVIGGGDWAEDRLVPDCIRALTKDEPLALRNPAAIRPWQHVLEPLAGYLLLAEKLFHDSPRFGQYRRSWNFGPGIEDMQPVERIVERFKEEYGLKVSPDTPVCKETFALRLDSSAARVRLGWKPRWDLDTALDKVMEWTRAWQEGEDVRGVCLRQLHEYMTCGK